MLKARRASPKHLDNIHLALDWQPRRREKHTHWYFSFADNRQHVQHSAEATFVLDGAARPPETRSTGDRGRVQPQGLHLHLWLLGSFGQEHLLFLPAGPLLVEPGAQRTVRIAGS